MSLGYFIDTEAPLNDLDPVTAVDGKSLAHADPTLEAQGVYERLGVPPLASFFGQDTADFYFDDDAPTGSAWFDPAEGLKTLHALLAYLPTHKGTTEGVAEDLEAMIAILKACQAQGTRWHLGVDF